MCAECGAEEAAVDAATGVHAIDAGVGTHGAHAHYCPPCWDRWHAGASYAVDAGAPQPGAGEREGEQEDCAASTRTTYDDKGGEGAETAAFPRAPDSGHDPAPASPQAPRRSERIRKRRKLQGEARDGL